MTNIFTEIIHKVQRIIHIKYIKQLLVDALRIAKIRSNLHTGQYAGSIADPSDHKQLGTNAGGATVFTWGQLT